jgi:hypothetical protein
VRVKIHPKDSPDFLLARNISPRSRKRAAKASTPEAVIQDMVEQYMDARGIPYLHIPAFLLNAAFAMRGKVDGAVMGAMRNAAASVRGFPDVVGFNPRNFTYCPIELKTEIGKMTDSQEMWARAIGTKTCRSFDEARATLDTWWAKP